MKKSYEYGFKKFYFKIKLGIFKKDKIVKEKIFSYYFMLGSFIKIVYKKF